MARIILDVSMGDTAAKPPFFSTGIISWIHEQLKPIWRHTYYSIQESNLYFPNASWVFSFCHQVILFNGDNLIIWPHNDPRSGYLLFTNWGESG